MNLFSFLHRPQPWSWFIQDDPNPEPSRLGLMDRRADVIHRCTHMVTHQTGMYRCEFPINHDGHHYTHHGATP